MKRLLFLIYTTITIVYKRLKIQYITMLQVHVVSNTCGSNIHKKYKR